MNITQLRSDFRDVPVYIISDRTTSSHDELPNSIVIGMPNDVYHASPPLSNSGLSLLAESPANYAMAEDKDPTVALRFGTALHCAVLEPDRYNSEYIVLDVEDRRSAVYTHAVKKFTAEYVLLRKEHEAIEIIKSQFSANSEIAEILSADGISELAMFAFDPDTGLRLKCKFDWLWRDDNGGYHAIDIKKTRARNYRELAASFAKYGYHRQEAFYRRVFRLATDTELASFSFLTAQDESPYEVKLRRYDEISREIGEHELGRLLRIFAECQRENHWPYPEDDGIISLPDYAIIDYENTIAEAII